jgi:hypothetical protein
LIGMGRPIIRLNISMDSFTLVAVVVVVAFIAYAVYTSIQAGRARTSELKTLAPQLGLTFVGDFAPTSAANATGDPRHDFEALRAAFGDFRRFQGSMRPRLWNWMRGERDGASISLFDYDEGHTERDISRIQTLAWIDDPSLKLPPFSLVPIPGRYGGLIRTTQAMAGVAGSSRHRERGDRHADARGIREPLPAPWPGRDSAATGFHGSGPPLPRREPWLDGRGRWHPAAAESAEPRRGHHLLAWCRCP